MATAPPSWLNVAQRLMLQNAALKEAIWQAICDVRVAIPGIVKEFDENAQTVTVQLSVTENFVDPQTLEKKPEKFPVLSDVPIILPRAGGFTITMPITAGDEVLVLFADFDYGAWWQSGGEDNDQVTRRRHDLSDGFAILAPWSQPRVLEDYSTTAFEIRSDDGTRKISITDTDINITVQGGKVTVTSDDEVDITSSNGKIVLNSTNDDIDINATGGDVIVGSDGEVVVDAPSINITGGGTSIDGKPFLTHQHSGVQTGAGATGPVT